MQNATTTGDLLYGLGAIAEHLGITTPQAKHRAREKHFPTFRMGRIVCASKAQLAQHFAAQRGEVVHDR
jgi:hypothetical protein